MKILKAISQIIGAATLLCVFGFSAHAQENDSIAFYNNRDTTFKYVSPLEYAFMMHEETKFMLRVPVFGVGAEVEILPYFTWMSQAYFPMGQLGSGSLIPDINSEFRWYYSSKKLGVRNMSGNYIAAGAKYGEESWRVKTFSTLGYYLKWGMQRRILGNGLSDIGIAAGFATHRIDGTSQVGFFVQSPVSLGLGFVFGDRASLDRQRLCPVLKCHEVESFLLKINFSNLINYNSLDIPSGHLQLLSFNPHIAVEKKIFDSPFSVNFDLQSWFIYEEQTIGSESSGSGENRIDLAAGLRWYYNMNRRMRLGKGGNGLSGNYISAGIVSQYSSEEVYFRPIFNFQNRIYSFVSTGIQRTLGRRLYYDLNIGFRYASRTVSDLDLRETIMETYGNAQIGVKF